MPYDCLGILYLDPAWVYPTPAPKYIFKLGKQIFNLQTSKLLLLAFIFPIFQDYCFYLKSSFCLIN